MKKLWLCGVCLCVFATTSVMAADLPPRYPTKAPPAMVPFYSWSGAYFGVNAGWAWISGSGDWTIGGATGTTSGSGDGFTGGVQLGYNWQTSSWVFGVETDFQFGTGKGNASGTAGATTFTGTVKTPWFGTIRGRFGYAVDRWLFYVTGGAAYGETKLEGTLSTTGPFTSTANYWTWTAGGGVEAAFWGRWSGKLEYLYIDTPNKVPAPPGTTNVGGRVDTHVVRAGLNYRF